MSDFISCRVNLVIFPKFAESILSAFLFPDTLDSVAEQNSIFAFSIAETKSESSCVTLGSQINVATFIISLKLIVTLMNFTKFSLASLCSILKSDLLSILTEYPSLFSSSSITCKKNKFVIKPDFLKFV